MAIKKTDLTHLEQEECYNIHREALYLESFKHKNIIKFTHSFIYENEFYNVMDYAKGGELGAYVSEKGNLPEKEAKKIFIQLHEAVKYIHSKSVIHRDLKPNNILFLDEKKENVVVIILLYVDH
jgi:serine/threonine protein kinase